MNKYTNLHTSNTTFHDSVVLSDFGIVTIMDAEIYEIPEGMPVAEHTPYQIVKTLYETDPICTLDTLKVANVTQDGPSKTITGGQFSNPLVKFGKSARLEMQNALGNSKAIEALCGGFQEFNEYSVVVENPDGEPTTEIRQTLTAMHFGEDFSGPKTIVGDTFIINRKTGQQVPVKIVFYQFLPDSIFNLTQDAEGDATVFDMNGDLLTTVITVGEGIKKGVFYSILDPVHLVEINAIPSSRITLDANGGSFVDGEQQRSMVRQFAITKNKYETPTRDKYDFVDWYYDQNQTDYVVDNISIDQPTTLYAGWAVQTVKETWHSSGSGTADTRLQTLTLSAPITFDSKYVTGTLKISGRINALIGSARVTASVYETELYWSTSKTAEYDEWKPLIKNGRENFLDSLGVPLHIQIRSRLTPTGQVMDDPVTISYKKTAI